MKKRILLAATALFTVCFASRAQQDSLITVAMCGDIMMGTTYPTVRLPQNGGAHIFDDVKQLFLDADLSVGNLEGVICEGGTCTKNTGKANNYAFRMPVSYTALLKDAGFDCVNLANNHTNDFGAAGRKSTCENLDQQGIRYTGLADCESVVIEKNGIKFGVCSFGTNSHTLKHTDTNLVKRIIGELRPQCDILVVNFHGGAEGTQHSHLPEGTETYLGENRGSLRSFAHLCVDLGADLVFGHGPHVTRAIECYNGHLIAYSLGNFCTTYGINVSGLTGYAPVLVARLSPDGRLVDGRIHSFIQRPGTGPKLDSSNKVARHMRDLSISDFHGNNGLVIDDDGSFKQ
ncbi:MAG: CapA family protein [Bacteroidales bacterium]|nr:CapA family protein [Bacteroidales bacterium]